MKLPAIKCVCSQCRRDIESADFEPMPQKKGAPKATTYESCLRRCEHCGLGYSNAYTDDATKLAIILRDPFTGIPCQIAAGHDRALSEAINIRNRPSKQAKFASLNSEDHVTWTIFRYLQDERLITSVLASSEALPSPAAKETEPCMLLWGSPVPSEHPEGRNLRRRLEKLCDTLGENPVSRSEPDVILDFGAAGIVFIEVKLRSPNDVKPADYRSQDGTSKWDKYLRDTRAFRDGNAVRESGLYELTRNWRLAWDLADGCPMHVVNLGPAELNDGPFDSRVKQWVGSLEQDEKHRFQFLSWPTLIKAMPIPPPWLSAYLLQRGLGQGKAPCAVQ